MGLPSPEEVDQMMAAEGAQSTSAPSVGALPSPSQIQAMMEAESAPKGPTMYPPTFQGYMGAAGDLISEIPGNLWSGIKKAPAAVGQMVSDIPEGASNLAHLPLDLGNATNDALKLALNNVFGTDYFDLQANKTDYGRAERTLKGIANLGIGAAGLTVGGPAGGAVAPNALEQVFQTLGISPQTNPDDDLKKMTEDTGTMIALNAATNTISAIPKTAAEKFPGLANALDRKSLGTRQSDYGKSSETRTIETPEGGIETYVKNKLDSLLEEGKLGKSRDPEVVSKVIDDATKPLKENVNSIIKTFDDNNALLNQSGKGVQVYADFPTARQMIADGKIPADKIANFERTLQEIQDVLDSRSQGKVSYLQQQKIAYGKSWDPLDKVKSNFDRAVYEDLKNTIENYTPEVKPLNAELSKWETADPIVARSLRAKESRSVMDDIKGIGYTTGGIGAPTLLGAHLGGPAGAIAGAGVGLLGKALATPGGQAAIARALRTTGSIAENVAPLTDLLKKTVKLGATENLTNEPITDIYTGPNAEKNSQLKQSLNNVLGDTAINSGEYMSYAKKPVKAVLDAVKADPVDHAIALMESNLDPKAKNKESSASGLFQLIKSTASKLGVKDVFDAGENYDGYLKLKQAAIDKFDLDPNDYKSIYAVHYLGETAYRKWINDEPLSKTQQDQVDYLESKLFPKLDNFYTKAIKDSGVSLV